MRALTLGGENTQGLVLDKSDRMECFTVHLSSSSIPELRPWYTHFLLIAVQGPFK